MIDRWLIVKEIALELLPDKRPMLAYAVLPDLGSFPTAELAHVALDGLGLYLGTAGSLGWVVTPASRLLPHLAEAPPEPRYAACRQCDECNHAGINDEHETDAACSACGWGGLSPSEDRCPACGSPGTMSAACPKCSGRYALIAERDR